MSRELAEKISERINKLSLEEQKDLLRYLMAVRLVSQTRALNEQNAQ